MKRLFRISILFSLLLLAKLPCSASIVSKSTGIHTPFGSNDLLKSENHNIYFALLSNYNTAQLTRPEVQRSVQFARELFIDNVKYNLYFNTLHNKYFAHNTGHTRLRRLMLFPFHVFW